jgi:hypothetical protein
MSFSLFKRVVDELAGLPYSVRLALSYDGETLSHPDFPDMLQYAKGKRKFSIRFHTNGTLLNRLNHVDLEGVKIILSDHGLPPPKEIGLIRLVGLVDYEGHNVEERIKMWNSLGLPVNLNPNIKSLNDDLSNWGRRRQNYCVYPFTTIYVMADEDVKLCCRIRADTTVGNLQGGSLLEFWRGETMEMIRTETRKYHTPRLPDCMRCSLWRFLSYSKRYPAKSRIHSKKFFTF